MFIISIHKKTIQKAVVFTLAVLFTVSCICFATFAKPQDGVDLPIIMYHSVLKSSNRIGSYVAKVSQLEEDMKIIKENGYETVLMQDVVSYVEGEKDLPSKPIVLSFDDGFYNNLAYVYPLLEKYDMKAIIAPVGVHTEQAEKEQDPNPAYAYLKWEDISNLSKTGRVEIANHSYNMHKHDKRRGAQKLKNEDKDEYIKALKDDLGEMQEKLTKNSLVTPITFAYPFGGISKESIEPIKEMGFKCSFSCYELVSKITKDKNSLYQLGRFNRSGDYNSYDFLKKVGVIK